MDQTRKRSRERSDGADERGGGRRKKTAPQTIKAVEDKVEESTTEEEVEEFYAIVRRMQAAVKYFDKGKDQNIPAGDNNPVRWRIQLESRLPVAVDADVKTGANSDDDDVIAAELARSNSIVALDLNEVPVDDSMMRRDTSEV